jgi:hypothetical protein
MKVSLSDENITQTEIEISKDVNLAYGSAKRGVKTYLPTRFLGQTLNNRLKQSLTLQEALDLSIKLCNLLDDLHSGRLSKTQQSYVHGDLNLHNVVIDSDLNLHLIDFGRSNIGPRKKFNDLNQLKLCIRGLFSNLSDHRCMIFDTLFSRPYEVMFQDIDKLTAEEQRIYQFLKSIDYSYYGEQLKNIQDIEAALRAIKHSLFPVSANQDEVNVDQNIIHTSDTPSNLRIVGPLLEEPQALNSESNSYWPFIFDCMYYGGLVALVVGLALALPPIGALAGVTTLLPLVKVIAALIHFTPNAMMGVGISMAFAGAGFSIFSQKKQVADNTRDSDVENRGENPQNGLG